MITNKMTRKNNINFDFSIFDIFDHKTTHQLGKLGNVNFLSSIFT